MHNAGSQMVSLDPIRLAAARLVALATRLGHDVGPPVREAAGAWVECRAPGCNMGATADYSAEGAPRVSGMAIRYQCPGEHNV